MVFLRLFSLGKVPHRCLSSGDTFPMGEMTTLAALPHASIIFFLNTYFSCSL